MSVAMIEITTSSSTSVKPRRGAGSGLGDAITNSLFGALETVSEAMDFGVKDT